MARCYSRRLPSTTWSATPSSEHLGGFVVMIAAGVSLTVGAVAAPERLDRPAED